MQEDCEDATEGTAETTVGIVGGVEHTMNWLDDWVGKKSPFFNGSGRVGLDAVPTGFPLPGNFGALAAGAAAVGAVVAAGTAATARAAW